MTYENIFNNIKLYFKNYWWKLLIITFLLAVDLITKALIVPQNQETWQEVEIIKDILVIAPTRNIGAGFSILQGQTWLLITLTVLFIVAITIFDMFYKKKSKLYGISTAIIFAGAVGNLVDRIAFGYVRDFLFFKFINFPVFNVADMALTIGIALLLIYVIFYSGKAKNNDTKYQNAETINANDERTFEQNENKDAPFKNTETSQKNNSSNKIKLKDDEIKEHVIDNNSQIYNGDHNAEDNN